MSSILPKINKLQDIPIFNAKYADGLLTLFVESLLSLNEIDIGEFRSADERGSVIAFDSDDFENVRLELKYSEDRFIIELTENSEENFACVFRYKIFQGTDLYLKIPEKLRLMMIEAEENLI